MDVGIRLGRIGNSSLRYELAIFIPASETPAAVGHFVHVYVDAATRRSVSLAESQKAAVADLLAA